MIRGLVRQVRPDTLLSWPVFSVTLAWVLVARLLLGSSLSVRSVVTQVPLILAAQAMTFAFLWLVAKALEGLRLRGTTLSVALILAIPVAGALYGAALTVGVWWTGLTPEPDVPARAAVSATAIGLPLLLATIAVGHLHSYLSVSEDLQGQQARLLALRERTHEQLQRTHEELVAAVSAQLRAELGTLPTNDASSVPPALRRTIDNVVRPLSHSLAESEELPIEVTARTDPLKIDIRRTLRDAADPTFLQPWPITTITGFMVAPVILMIAGPLVGLTCLGLGLVVDWLLLSLTRDLGWRLTGDRPWFVKASVFIGALALSGLALTAGWRYLLDTLSDAGSLTIGGMSALDYFRPQNFLVFVVVGYLVAVYYAARRQAVSLAEELESTDRELRWEISRQRELERQRRAELANVLHGKVQAALTAACLRIEHDTATGNLTAAVFDEVRAQIESSIAELGTSSSPDPLAEVVDLVRGTWAGVAQIDLSCSPAADSALAGDPSCLYSLNDLVPELCFNAIKHAHADQLRISVDLGRFRSVRLMVSNNGIPPDDRTVQGLGYRLLDTSSMWWRRTHRDGWTTTTCELPCSAGNDVRLPSPG